MNFYIKKTKDGKPVTTGVNNDCLIYMRQYGGPNTAFDNGVFIISTGERIKPNLWDDGKNYPKKSETNTIEAIELFNSDAANFMAVNKRSKVVTTTALLREQLNPTPVPVTEVESGTMLSYWDARLAARPMTAAMKNNDQESFGRETYKRWLMYEEQLWNIDKANKTLTTAEKNHHKIPDDPRNMTREMYDRFEMFMLEVEKKAYNTIKQHAQYFKALCIWINETKNIRVGFPYEKIDTNQRGAAKGKVTLTKNQVKMISDLTSFELKEPQLLEYSRDMMLLQIRVGVRISDLFRIAEHTDRETGVCNMELTKRVENGSGKRIKQKLVTSALDILKKYNYVTPKISRSYYTDNIRKLIKMVAPDEKITIRNPSTGKFEKKLLWEVYSSHDNIRTCVKLADQARVPLSSIAYNVGKTLQTLQRHYLATEEEVAMGDWGRLEGSELPMAASKKTGRAKRVKA